MMFLLRSKGGGSSGGSSIPGLDVTTINGQPMLTLVDSTRSSKILSVAENVLSFSTNNLSDLEWLSIGNATDADSGYVADFDGTVVAATGQCENTGANSKDIHLYINGTDQGAIGNLSGGNNASFINTTLNFDFSQGDKIRLQAQGAGAQILDTVVKVTLKWRG